MKVYLDRTRCGLMLTKNDTQGVMSCELATYGILLITSDIDICQEVFSNFDNVTLVSNNSSGKYIEVIKEKLCGIEPKEKCRDFFASNTINEEVQLYGDVMSNERIQ